MLLERLGKRCEKIADFGFAGGFFGDKCLDFVGQIPRVVDQLSPQAAALPPAVVSRSIPKAHEQAEDQCVDQPGFGTEFVKPGPFQTH